ncbi:Ion-translocating oxidoreductase complex subunit G [Gammaproteobacteria bacterium]
MNTDQQSIQTTDTHSLTLSKLTRTMARAAGLLGIFAAVGTAALALTYTITKDRIEANAHAALVRNLQQIIPAGRYDNDIATDTLEIHESSLSIGGPVTIHRARKEGVPVAVVFTTVAPNGYSGNINLLIGVNVNGTVAGVRVVTHKETPGLGDKIEVERSPWITRFTGLALNNPEASRWTVKKDGGAFDQFSGATITPRAVVGAVRRTLQYYEAHRDVLFAPRSEFLAEGRGS